MIDEDKNLLELAAKAAGLKNYRYCPAEDGLHACIEYDDEDDCTVVWMPHLDDGDALRLAVKTGEPFVVRTRCVTTMGGLIEDFDPSKQGDDLLATRRVIVRAAAEIGKAMQ